MARTESINPTGDTEAWHVLTVNNKIHFRTSKIQKQNKWPMGRQSEERHTKYSMGEWTHTHI